MFLERNSQRSRSFSNAINGGYGFNKEYTMERKYRDVWGWGIAGGTIDIQKINITSAMVGKRFNQRK